MTDKNQFEKPLKVMKICLMLSGINVYKAQYHNVLETFIIFLYYFNLLILYSVIFGEVYWLVDGIQTGRDFVEMSLTAPCITISILSTLKTIPLYIKRDIVCQIIDTLKDIHPETDYKGEKDNVEKKVNQLEEHEDLNTHSYSFDENQQITDEELAKESVKLLTLVEFLLLSICVAVLITFLLAPLVLIYWEYGTTGDMKIKYPFSVKYWFDAYQVSFWPLLYFQQVWASEYLYTFY